MHQPGEAWMYTTGGLLLQGVLVRRASGQDFDAFMHERIFDPLGMKDTGFFVPPASRLLIQVSEVLRVLKPTIL